MRAYALLAALALIMTATSGCFADGDGKTASASTSATTSGDNATLPTGNATANTAPTIVVKILVNGTEVALTNDTYSVPSMENVTFDASNSTDAEGANLTFAWDFGDGNTSTEAVAVYAYSAAGNFTLNLTVSDADGASESASYPLVVAPSGPAPGTVLRDEKKTYTGTYTVGAQGLSCVANVQGVAASKANEFIVPDVDADSGATVGANKFVIDLKGGQTTVDQAFRFVGPDGKTIKDVDEGSGNAEKLELEGEFPAGKYTITVYGCAAVNGSWTLTVTATLVAV